MIIEVTLKDDTHHMLKCDKINVDINKETNLMEKVVVNGVDITTILPIKVNDIRSIINMG